MKKINQKGFIMAETIIVSVIVLTALVIIYAQFISVNNSYQKSFKYNNVDDLYKVHNIREFVVNNINHDFLDEIDNNYIDITECQSSYFTEYTYCRTLFEELNVKKAIITEGNLSDFNTISFEQGMSNFINTIKNEGNGYRIIVEFEDTYATLKFNVIGG